MLNLFNLTAKYLFICLLLTVTSQAFAQQGKLFIIGGGARSTELIQSLIKTADMAEHDYMIVLPMSSGEPEASFEAIKKQLTAAARNKIGNLNFTAETVNNKKMLDSLKRAKLIFITGGDQSRFMKVVLNTPVYPAIHHAYEKGATIAGTSAGAAVMSKYMITGKQLLDTNYKETFNKLLAKNVEFDEGLGLLKTVIIDQHFLKRSRYNRLISALAAYPTYDCIGIDEGTAMIVRGKKVSIAGESQVLKLSKPKQLKVNANKLITLQDLHFSLYAEGDEFSIK
jgi:cyanophycinase